MSYSLKAAPADKKEGKLEETKATKARFERVLKVPTLSHFHVTALNKAIAMAYATIKEYGDDVGAAEEDTQGSEGVEAKTPELSEDETTDESELEAEKDGKEGDDESSAELEADPSEKCDLLPETDEWQEDTDKRNGTGGEAVKDDNGRKCYRHRESGSIEYLKPRALPEGWLTVVVDGTLFYCKGERMCNTRLDVALAEAELEANDTAYDDDVEPPTCDPALVERPLLFRHMTRDDMKKMKAMYGPDIPADFSRAFAEMEEIMQKIKRAKDNIVLLQNERRVLPPLRRRPVILKLRLAEDDYSKAEHERIAHANKMEVLFDHAMAEALKAIEDDIRERVQAALREKYED